ncbi:HAD-IA family hydrolase [Halalkalibacterium halodurans]|jgi:putative hydrolase of the HAD superfamily|uniref:HAD family hydrolase n=1 Tax=Halalkalibacterium halodurans TaxID=86665 RepID=UPI0006825B0D|nr:HAD-IA family hydrolase [Halalkalibacterium halodurans]MDY7220936.1 HAD-IA family hydrolase [Halalkalibacterium halodurans]MDY7240175.1 HAD-IA family hydrolase [Halalkalibacterium halodurans]MED4082518.1 HAD-IA family hydrolase [Halalkalibacterium halodurans]MED4085763.1 HAD-IA family hydrolase [Halalkalibacterium halodurans]MED4105629.1 HAD-IA family hydrolase [Halalkalibacterium halodurans]
MEGSLELLSVCKLKNYRLGIITNGESLLQRIKLKKLGIERYFEVVVISEEVGISKPHGVIFRKAVDMLGVQVGHSIYIGDHLYNDIYGASLEGLYTI